MSSPPNELPMQRAGRTGTAVLGFEFKLKSDDGQISMAIWERCALGWTKQEGRGELSVLSLTSQNGKKAEEELRSANETLEDKVLVRTGN